MLRRRDVNRVLEEDRLRQLIALGPQLVAERDLDALLDRLLATACSVTAAKYAALGILDEEHDELERFITRGISEEDERAIGDRPRGRGVLGVLIHDPRPLRLTDVTTHPSSSGFPPRHPRMRSFLGVPIVIRGEAWGNLYLTEKRIGEFTEADEYAATTLATWAAIAIDHARLLAGTVARQGELDAAVRRLEATQAVAVAVGEEEDPARVLELVADRGRAVVEARGLLILLREDTDLVIAAAAGETEADTGARLPIVESISEQVMLSKRPARVDDPSPELQASFGVPEARSALLVPLVYRGEALGVMAAFDLGSGSPEVDEEVLVALAASAATAVGQHRPPQQIS